MDGGGPYLKGHYRGHPVRVSFTVRNRLTGPSSFHRCINAFYIQLCQVPGGQDWSMQYSETGGFFQQTGVSLSVRAKDGQLAQRLEQARAKAAVSALGGGTTCYETARYHAQEQVLYYTTNVAPKDLLSPQQFEQQLDMLLRLAAINQQVNPALPAEG